MTHNSSHVISELLDSIPGALAGLSATTIVVDNASTDATVSILMGRADVSVICSANLGYSSAINRGVLEIATGLPVLVLNPDVRLHPGSVRSMHDALRIPTTGIVAPRVYNTDGTVARSLRREPTIFRAAGLNFLGTPRFSEYLADPTDYEAMRVVDWALGAILLISRDCYEALGGFDESFFLYSEETDFCLRARDLGWVTRFTPQASAVHIGAQSGASPRIHTMQVVNRVRLYARRNSAIASYVYFLLHVLSEASWIIRGRRRSISAVIALLSPKRRPPEIRASDRLIPR